MVVSNKWIILAVTEYLYYFSSQQTGLFFRQIYRWKENFRMDGYNVYK
jgi:hypothetical protein